MTSNLEKQIEEIVREQLTNIAYRQIYDKVDKFKTEIISEMEEILKIESVKLSEKLISEIKQVKK